MRAVWFIGKFKLLLNCTNYPNYSPKSRTPQQPQNVSSNALGDEKRQKIESNEIIILYNTYRLY